MKSIPKEGELILDLLAKKINDRTSNQISVISQIRVLFEIYSSSLLDESDFAAFYLRYKTSWPQGCYVFPFSLWHRFL